MGVLVRGMAALLLVLAVGACSSPELSAQRAEDRRDAEIGAIEAPNDALAEQAFADDLYAEAYDEGTYAGDAAGQERRYEVGYAGAENGQPRDQSADSEPDESDVAFAPAEDSDLYFDGYREGYVEAYASAYESAYEQGYDDALDYYGDPQVENPYDLDCDSFGGPVAVGPDDPNHLYTEGDGLRCEDS